MDSLFLFRGVSEAYHRKNERLLKPKVQGPFTHGFRWNESDLTWRSGVSWGSTAANAVIRHQLHQEGFPTAGISTTPHFERAMFYARGPSGTAGGYVFKIDRWTLASEGIEQFVVSEFCSPSVPEDEEVILVVQNGLPLPVAVVVEVIEVRSLGAV